MKEWKVTMKTLEGKQSEFTLSEALKICAKSYSPQHALHDMIFYNVALRNALRNSSVEVLTWMLWEISDKEDTLKKELMKFREKYKDCELGQYDIQLRSIHEDFTLLGHTFHGLSDMKKYVEHPDRPASENPDTPSAEHNIHVGEQWYSYPCFDASDFLYENRTYQNYIVRNRPITEEDLEELGRVPREDNYRRVTEHIPMDMLPMVYYGGSDDFMLVATAPEEAEESTAQETQKEPASHSKQKTTVFNVVILDKSGSMGCIREAAIDGFNETLTGIKSAQEKYHDTQEHLVTLVTFSSQEIKWLLDRVPAKEARPLTHNDYQPCGCTPLYDAMGTTLTTTRQHVERAGDAMVVVTIITDGLENASREYQGSSIKALVEELKKKGWTFTYMGANQDALAVADSMAIRNARNFAYSDEGTRSSMAKDAHTRMRIFEQLHDFKESDKGAGMTQSEVYGMYDTIANNSFDEEEAK